jgi:hypothetical protein
MARRLTTNQEIAGSIPASIKVLSFAFVWCMYHPECGFYRFVGWEGVFGILTRFWMSGVTNIDRIDVEFDSQQRGHVELSTAVLDQTISRYLATWSSIEDDGSGMPWARWRDSSRARRLPGQAANESGVYRTRL